MKKALFLIAGLLILTAQSASADNGRGREMNELKARLRAERAKILEFDTMVGVSGPFQGPNNPIRNVPGGGAPWVISEGKGELRADGKLEIKVRGLIIPTTGTNPAASFRGLVSCMIITVVDGVSQPAIVNISTGDFPATPAGDADIEEMLELPESCFAPIIFVTNSAGRWFSVTGF